MDLTNGKILIVDDESLEIEILVLGLTLAGYLHVESTTNPYEVVDRCVRQQTDLLLLDWHMPGLNGEEVMIRLKEHKLKDPPVILVLTGENVPSVRQKALDSGARDFVPKPFHLDELLSRVRNLLEMKLLQNRMRIQNQVLEEVVKKRTSELITTMRNLQMTRLQVIRRLALAAEYRDNETGKHIVRMSRFCAKLGRLMGFDDFAVELLLHASPMHDLGKIGIPDSVLLKPGKLDPAEWELMRTHAQIGADLLSGDDSDLFQRARIIALTHHEKWNGKGYPQGLAEESIPMEGRICALADVFDALTSARPYKTAWPFDDAVELVRSEKGEHFDPKLVALFLDNIEDIREFWSMPFDENDTDTGV